VVGAIQINRDFILADFRPAMSKIILKLAIFVENKCEMCRIATPVNNKIINFLHFLNNTSSNWKKVQFIFENK